MGVIELLFVSFGLSLDSFAVSICKGLSMKKYDIKKGLIISLYFMIFHTLMTLIGFILGISFEKFITDIDHWIAFGLLSIIGLNMIKEALSLDENKISDKIDFKTMLPLALATSIDTLALGITFAFLKVNILLALLLIGIIIFTMSIIGFNIGNKFGNKYEKTAQIMGGFILILLGIKILIEHLM